MASSMTNRKIKNTPQVVTEVTAERAVEKKAFNTYCSLHLKTASQMPTIHLSGQLHLTHLSQASKRQPTVNRGPDFCDKLFTGKSKHYSR